MPTPTIFPQGIPNVNPAARAAENGFFFKNGGPLTADVQPTYQNQPVFFKYIGSLVTDEDITGASGNVVVQDFQGNPYVIAMPEGGIRMCEGTMILSSAVIDGTTYTTTAPNLWWYGGV